MRVQFTRTGKSKGISYGWQGVALAGNALGTRYSFKHGEPGLVKNLGLSYEPERDRPLIQALCERPPATLQTAPQSDPLAPALSLAVAQQQHQAWVLQVAAEAETERRLVAERQRLAAEAERQRLATEAAAAAEKARLAVEAERVRLAVEAERQRLEAEAAAEKARLVAEAARVRLAAAAEAERQRLAAEATALAGKMRLAAERQQQTAQREEWGWAMTKVAAVVLRAVQQVVYEGKHYRFRFDGKTLTIAAKDGRGVLVRRQGDQLLFVSDQITEADRDYFQAQGQALQQRLPTLDVLPPPPMDPKTTWGAVSQSSKAPSAPSHGAVPQPNQAACWF